MKKWIGLAVTLSFLFIAGVSYAQGAGMYVGYRLIDADEHLFHVIMVLDERMKVGVVNEKKIPFGNSTTKIENIRAINVREDKDLKAEVEMIRGCQILTVYVWPEGGSGDQMTDVMVRIEADCRDSESFFERERLLVFQTRTAFDTVEVILPSKYGLVYSDHPVLVFRVDGAVRVGIENEKGEEIKVRIEAVETKG